MKMRDGKEITLGSDVEFLLFHNKLMKFIPATGFNTIPTSDDREVLKWGDHEIGTYHRDNITVEVQTLVHKAAPQLVLNAQNLRSALGKIYKESINARVQSRSIAKFADDMLATSEANEMGCVPDFDAYSGKEMAGPTPAKMNPYRGAGGHIHIGGIEDMGPEFARLFAQCADVTLMLRLLSYEPGMHYRFEKSKLRRDFYGQAGRFRYKDYGVELRCPSNSWVSGNTARVANSIDTGVREAYDWAVTGKGPEEYGDVKSLQRFINKYPSAQGIPWRNVHLKWRKNVPTLRDAG